jgi:hypothetical protein
VVVPNPQAGNRLPAIGEGIERYYSWMTPDNTYGYDHGHPNYGRQSGTRAPYSPPQDRAGVEAHTLDLLSAIQDSLCDLELGLGSTDGVISEVGTSVDIVTEEVQALKEATDEGISNMRSDIRILAAQVSSLHVMLSEIITKIDDIANAGKQ